MIVRGGDNDVHLCYAIAFIFSGVFALPPSVHWISKIRTFFGEQQHCRNDQLTHTHITQPRLAGAEERAPHDAVHLFVMETSTPTPVIVSRDHSILIPFGMDQPQRMSSPPLNSRAANARTASVSHHPAPSSTHSVHPHSTLAACPVPLPTKCAKCADTTKHTHTYTHTRLAR